MLKVTERKKKRRRCIGLTPTLCFLNHRATGVTDRKEVNALFNDALNNTFYLRIYGVEYIVKDQSDSERRNPLHGLLFTISSKECFMRTIPLKGKNISSSFEGARCSSVVRAFAHGGMGRRIDPSWSGPIELFLVPASAP